jgi:hypothetical protein
VFSRYWLQSNGTTKRAITLSDWRGTVNWITIAADNDPQAAMSMSTFTSNYCTIYGNNKLFYYPLIEKVNGVWSVYFWNFFAGRWDNFTPAYRSGTRSQPLGWCVVELEYYYDDDQPTSSSLPQINGNNINFKDASGWHQANTGLYNLGSGWCTSWDYPTYCVVDPNRYPRLMAYPNYEWRWNGTL